MPWQSTLDHWQCQIPEKTLFGMSWLQDIPVITHGYVLRPISTTGCHDVLVAVAELRSPEEIRALHTGVVVEVFLMLKLNNMRVA